MKNRIEKKDTTKPHKINFEPRQKLYLTAWAKKKHSPAELRKIRAMSEQDRQKMIDAYCGGSYITCKAAENREQPISVTLTLPAHVWKYIEDEANRDYNGDISSAALALYHKSRIYNHLVAI